MHESTRKMLCRLAFVASCVVPTLLTVVCCVVVQTPWYATRQRAQLETALRHQFGLIFEIERLERPAPDSLHLHGVTIRDPENRAVVGRCRIVSWGKMDGLSGVRIGQPEMNGAALDRVWQLVHNRFLADPFLTAHDVNIQVNDLTLGSQTSRRTFDQLEMQVRPSAESIRASLQFSLAGNLGEEPAKVVLERFRGVEQPYTRWQLRSGATPLPCSLLSDYLPALRQLGPDAQFAGTMSWAVRSNRLVGDLSGSHFTDVNIAAVTEPLPHKMTGIADVHIRRGIVSNDAVTDFAGTIHCVGGMLGADTVAAAEQTLGLQFDREVGALPGGYLRYDEIVLHAEKKDDVFRISGHESVGEDAASQWVMRLGDVPSAWCDGARDIDRHQMISFLVDPTGRFSLPRSGVSDVLLRLLPASERERASDTAAPRVRIGQVTPLERR